MYIDEEGYLCIKQVVNERIDWMWETTRLENKKYKVNKDWLFEEVKHDR